MTISSKGAPDCPKNAARRPNFACALTALFVFSLGWLAGLWQAGVFLLIMEPLSGKRERRPGDGAIFAWDLSGTRSFGRPLALRVANGGPFRVVSGATLNAVPTPPLAVSSDSKYFAMRLQALQVGLFSVKSFERKAAFTVPVKRRDSDAVGTLAWSPRAPSRRRPDRRDAWLLERCVQAAAGSDPAWVAEPEGTAGRGGSRVQPRRNPRARGRLLLDVEDRVLQCCGRVARLRRKAPLESDSPERVDRLGRYSDDGRTMALGQSQPNGNNETQIVNAASGAVELDPAPARRPARARLRPRRQARDRHRERNRPELERPDRERDRPAAARHAGAGVQSRVPARHRRLRHRRRLRRVRQALGREDADADRLRVPRLARTVGKRSVHARWLPAHDDLRRRTRRRLAGEPCSLEG